MTKISVSSHAYYSVQQMSKHTIIAIILLCHYTVDHKKGANLFLSVISSKINGF